MTKITTDFAGSESIAVTKQRLTDILAYWGASTAAYTTWGQARTALNALLTSTTAGTIGSTELAGTFLPKINFLNDPDDMIADALFGAGEQGVWLDPSDVANVAWRRNTLLWTDSFSTAAWAKTSMLSFTPSATTAPDGTTTAALVTELSGSTLPNLRFANAPAINAGSMSVYAKSNGRNFVCLQMYGGAANKYATAIYDLSTETVTKTQAGTSSTISSPSIVPVGSGWYRLSFSYTTTAPAVSDTYIQLCGSGTPTIDVYGTPALYTGDGTSGTYLWGAQVEEGATLTAYQRITDLNTEVIERFPNATMYQDAAGTVPVYAPGQPVGLRLDKSKGLVRGPELVVNGTFETAAGWTFNPDWAYDSVNKRAYRTGTTYQNLVQPHGLTNGKTYVLTFTKGGGGGVQFFCADVFVASAGTPGTYQIVFQKSGSTSLWQIASSSSDAWLDNISVKELPGNHATQSTAGSRPMYGIEPKGGRRNQLTFSEDLSNAVWSQGSIVGPITKGSVSTNRPDGTTGPVSTLAFPAVGPSEFSVVFQNTGVTYLNTPATYSVWLRVASGTSTIYLSVEDTGAGPSGGNFFTSPALTLTTTWQRFTLTGTRTSTTGFAGAFIGFDTRAAAGQTNAAPLTVQVWGAQLETGSTATAYQKVTTAFDVTEAGVNSCHYCQYDGSDDGMVTNSIDFTATDKMSVFAGVRKIVETPAVGLIVELSASYGTNNGSMVFHTGTDSGNGPNYAATAKGTAGISAASFAVSAASFPAPITNVVTSLHDIAGDLSAMRVNGAASGVNGTADKGTGNFGNYPLYFGRRASTANPFYGRDYGIIITNKLANATAIATTEMWLANKTSGVTL